MTTDQTPDSQISLTLDRYGDVGKLVVDGVDMSHHVGAGFTLARDGRGIPTLTVALPASISYDGPAVLRLDDETAAMLARHGWTPPQEPTTLADVSGDEPVTDEPAIGAQVTDGDGDVWQRFEGDWCRWMGEAVGWSSWPHTWDYVQNYAPLRPTTDDDRRRVGLPVRDEDASPEPVEAAESDAQPEDVSEDPETENGPQNGAQGRIGWLRMGPDDDCRYLMREVPGGWTRIDTDDEDLVWSAKTWSNAEFTPIRTLADDEVAVKREDLALAVSDCEGALADALDGEVSRTYRECIARLRAVLEADR